MRLRWAVLGCVLLLGLGAEGGGCNNGVVGVQDYGAVTGRVIDSVTNRPVGGALISVGSNFTAHADAQGAFLLPHVPIGDQDVTARAAGYDSGLVTVHVKKNDTVSADFIKLKAVNGFEGGPPLPPPPSPTPTPFVWWSASPGPTTPPTKAP